MGDLGGVFAVALVLGLVYGIFGHGLGWLSQRIEDWKKRHWAERHNHLSPEEQQTLLTLLKRQRHHKSNMVVFALLCGTVSIPLTVYYLMGSSTLIWAGIWGLISLYWGKKALNSKQVLETLKS